MMNMRLIACVFICSFGAVIAHAPRIISRREWGARHSKEPLDSLAENPPLYVIIHHSTGASCYDERTCKSRVKSFQNYHMDNNHWDDIGYNFLVGEDGNVYEGRGWGKCGAHAPRYNSKSIGICVIGTFVSTLPNDAALDAIKDLIVWGAANGYITNNYKLLGHRQVRATQCPGDALYNEIKTWNHWSSIP